MSARNTVKSIQDIMRQDVGVDGDAQRLSQLCWMFFLKIIDDQDQQLEVMQDNSARPYPSPCSGAPGRPTLKASLVTRCWPSSTPSCFPGSRNCPSPANGPTVAAWCVACLK